MKNKTKIPENIIKAMKKREPFCKIAAQDTSRPVYHFASPANLMIDSWGGIYHDGYYHLFYGNNYDANPNRLGGLFGHIRSKNLVDWEELPFPLLLLENEEQLNDGMVVIDPSGKPLMYYTRCFEGGMLPREHIAVRGSEDMLVWERMNEGKAFMTMQTHGGPRFTNSWSDVILFQEAGRTFMIISKCKIADSGKEVIPIYEAMDETWLNWEYRGIFAEHTGEVLNFIKIRDKWVLIYSPYSNPKWFIGDFDVNTYRFTEEKEGILSYGYIKQGNFEEKCSRGFYATTVFQGKGNVNYISGWITGFPGSVGWDGCISLTRVLDIDNEGNLIMNPAPQLDGLRMEKVETNGNELTCGRCFEFNFATELEDGEIAEIMVEESFVLTISNHKIRFNDIEVDYNFKDKISFRLYVDVSMAEVFFDGGKLNLSRCFSEMKQEAKLQINCPKAYTSYAYKLGAKIFPFDTEI